MVLYVESRKKEGIFGQNKRVGGHSDSRQITDGGVGHRGWEAEEVNGEILQDY